MMKVLVSDNISPKGVEIMRQAGLHVDVRTGMGPEELKEALPAYHGLVIRSATRVTAEIIEAAAKNLKVIGRAGSGLDNVDRAAATKKGIVVMNTPGGNTITAAEHTMALLFSLARPIPRASASMKEGRWEKKKFMGVELYGKTLGLVGMGNIGSQVAKKAGGLEMSVIAYDPFLNEETAKDLGVEPVGLEELWKRADFITVHTPLTPDTKNIISAATIARMKDGVRIINCARGGIVNEADLLAALESGKVAGAALDVFEKEPPSADYPLCKHEKVVCTPHLGASTQEAQDNVAVAVAEQVADYLIRGTIRNAVNFPSVPAEQAQTLAPYINLAERMGGFAAQVFEFAPREITIEYMGEASGFNTGPVTMAALKGFLAPALGDTVNFVNAPVTAKERGIEIRETRTPEAGDYRSMLCLRIRGEKTGYICGTLFSRKDPRITGIDGAQVEIIPEGTMLFMVNNDRPGLIGAVGTFLGGRGINIARMFFGRESEGGTAVSAVSVDSPLTGEMLRELRKIPNILSVKQVVL